MTENEYHIIGGGIVGASIAYHLSLKTDDSVTVYERSSLASETTDKSFAFFGYYGDDVQYRMKRYAMNLYNEFMADPHTDPEYRLVGQLQISTTDDGDQELRKKMRERPQRQEDEEFMTSSVQYLESEALSEQMVLPFLDTEEVTGSIYRPQVGYMTPRKLAFEFAERAKENGVAFQTDTRVTDIHTEGNRVTAIEVNGERMPAEAVICAAGPWNLKLAEKAGIEIPVRHTLAPVLKFEPESKRQYTLPWITHHESGFSIRRNIDGTVLMVHHPTGGHEAATEYDPDELGEKVPDDLRENGLETLETLLPMMEDATIVDEWVGIRSSTPDRNPVVGWTSLQGFSIAAFSTSGIQLSPAVGSVIASQVIDGDPTNYYEDLSPNRFDGYEDWKK